MTAAERTAAAGYATDMHDRLWHSPAYQRMHDADDFAGLDDLERRWYSWLDGIFPQAD